MKLSPDALATYFEPGLYDRMLSRYAPVVDVVTIARDCVDFARSKPVSNINGLFVTRCRAAWDRSTHTQPLSPAKRLEEAERHAAFACQLYQLIVEQQLGPEQIAAFLEDAGRQGLQVNGRLIDRLRTMGDRWPRAEAAC